MLLSLSWGLALGVVVLTVLRNPKTSRALWTSEQSAHSAATEKRTNGLETRRETRYRSDWPAAASILGDPNRQSPCRVVDVSRSGMRIASPRSFAKGTQVHVQWGGEFFVGAVLYTLAGKKEKEYISGLELLSGNHRWHPFGRFRFWMRSDASRN
jgi:PilZ domain